MITDSVKNNSIRLLDKELKTEQDQFQNKLDVKYKMQDSLEPYEPLPDYSCSVFKAGILKRKLEFQDLRVPARDRAWHDIVIVIQGTLCSIYKLSKKNSIEFYNQRDSISISKDSIISEESYEPKSIFTVIDFAALTDIEKDLEPLLIRRYSLAYGQAGLATDYTKKSHCIRVRIENVQFLLSLSEISEAVSWIEAFQSGINIALDLDTMNIPQFAALSRRRRNRRLNRNRLTLFEGSNTSVSVNRNSSAGSNITRLFQGSNSHRHVGNTENQSRSVYINYANERHQNQTHDSYSLNFYDEKSIPFTLSFIPNYERNSSLSMRNWLGRGSGSRPIEKAHVSVLLAAAPYEEQIIINGSLLETKSMPSVTNSLSIPRKIKNIIRLFDQFKTSSTIA